MKRFFASLTAVALVSTNMLYAQTAQDPSKTRCVVTEDNSGGPAPAPMSYSQKTHQDADTTNAPKISGYTVAFSDASGPKVPGKCELGTVTYYYDKDTTTSTTTDDKDKKAKEEADKKAKEEADKKAKEEADKKAKEEADKKAKEEADKKAKEEADKKANKSTTTNTTSIKKLPHTGADVDFVE